jgi:hypothetical protein
LGLLSGGLAAEMMLGEFPEFRFAIIICHLEMIHNGWQIRSRFGGYPMPSQIYYLFLGKTMLRAFSIFETSLVSSK